MEERRCVLIGVGGGIAAYKVCEIVSALAKSDIDVRVVLTDSAKQFVSALTFACLSRHRAYTDNDFWNAENSRPLHIELGEWASVILLAPLTANTLAKLSHGLADNLLTNIVLASSCPVLVAPAMNTDMWQQQSVQNNWKSLTSSFRYHGIYPNSGMLACDRIGMGRMAEPVHIVSQVRSLLHTRGTRDFIEKHILISAGSTREFLDPVRFLGNPSTGKMGLALAQAAVSRGATVTLVHGPMEQGLLSSISGVERCGVTSAMEMQAALMERAPHADWVVMAAAVADVKPADFHVQKLPKQSLPDNLKLAPVPDILSQLSAHRQPHQVLIGFAAQTGDIMPMALDKLKRKNVDVIVANPIDREASGFSSDTNRAVMLNRLGDRRDIPLCSKLEMAHYIYDFVLSTVSS